MEIEMSWRETCNYDPARRIEELVHETVAAFRARGCRVEPSIEQAGERLGLSGRKTRSLYYAQPVAIAREEYRRVTARFEAHLEAETDDLLRRVEALRAKRAALKAETA